MSFWQGSFIRTWGYTNLRLSVYPAILWEKKLNLQGAVSQAFPDKSFIYQTYEILYPGFRGHFNENHEDHKQGQILIFTPSQFYT